MEILKIVNKIKQFFHWKELKYVYKKFNEYNEKYFNGELPEIEMTIENDLGEIWGQFSSYTDLEKQIIFPVKIRLNMKELQNEYVFRNVLIHEMVHYWDCIINQPTEQKWGEANKIRYKWGSYVREHADNNLIRLGYWTAINQILGLHTENDHSPEFKEKCHELNEKFTELHLSEKVFGPKL
jgi:hypothetical protein